MLQLLISVVAEPVFVGVGIGVEMRQGMRVKQAGVGAGLYFGCLKVVIEMREFFLQQGVLKVMVGALHFAFDYSN